MGRSRELTQLETQLERVRAGVGTDTPGRCVLVRGRRRVGKSRLIEKFCDDAGVPSLFFTASRQGARELELLTQEVSESNLVGRDLFVAANPTTWDAGLRLLAASLDDTQPAIVVIDEFPYLATDDPSVEATFQKQWDRLLSRKPVLLVLIGSDIAMMEALNTHGRAFFQRGTEMLVPPLSPVETAKIVGSATEADAFDAYLITGGSPLICGEWPDAMPLKQYLFEALHDQTSALIVSAERVLAAEFPTEAHARAVLGQIGHGEVTYTTIARAAGGMHAASVSRSLAVLTSKRMVVRETPLSTKASKEARYRIADPYMRFWLRFIGPGLAEIERGRADRVLARIEQSWTDWRGKAIEPLVREALSMLAPVAGLPDAEAVGGFWTRTNVPEIDLIGANKVPVADRIAFAGTIKWLDNAALTQAHVNQLAADVLKVPGASASTPLVAVSRSGVTATNAIALGPADLLAAW